MAESYKKIYPGNWVSHINAWPLPNAEFKKNKRPAGDPHDRQQQGVLYLPGFIAVQKVAFARIEGGVEADGAVHSYDLTIGSPDTRGDDKPRADIKGLVVPEGALLYRAGFRVSPIGAQPGYYSSGAKDLTGNDSSGLLAAPACELWLEAAAAPPAGAPTTGAITANASNTLSLKAPLTGEFAADEVLTSLTDPVLTTAEQTFRLYTDKGSLGANLLGGVYVVAEVCYLVNDSVVDLESCHLPGAAYSGYTG